MKIGIIGAGPAGLSVAIGLHSNHQVSLFEGRSSYDEYKEEGFLGLQSNGLKALDKLGIELEGGCIMPRMKMDWSDGRHLGSVSNGSKERNGIDGRMITRKTIHQQLYQKCKSLSIAVCFDKKVSCIEQVEDKVILSFTDASTESFDLCIGADGIHSIARKYVDDVKPSYSGLVGLGGYSTIRDHSGVSDCVMTFGKTGFVGYTPYTSTNTNSSEIGWWCTFQHDEPRRGDKIDYEEIKKKVLDRVQGWNNPIEEIILNTDSNRFLFQPVYSVTRLSRWFKGRIVLIGDAAHAMPPHSGQGISQAFEDAVVLSAYLNNYKDEGTSIEGVLYKYQVKRKSHVEKIITFAERQGESKKDLGSMKAFLMKWFLWILFGYILKDSFSDWIMNNELV